MRIETELDEIHAKRLLELQHHSNKSLPQLVADILIKALDETTFPPETEGKKCCEFLRSMTCWGVWKEMAALPWTTKNTCGARNDYDG